VRRKALFVEDQPDAGNVKSLGGAFILLTGEAGGA
jgi:hypothetical protein